MKKSQSGEYNESDFENITGPYLRPQVAAGYLGISISSFYNLVQKGLLPAPIKMGPRAACVPKAWLDEAMSERAALKKRP